MQLSKQTLGQVPDTIRKPSYNLDDVKVGVLHFGPSFFFRGHLAVYFDDLLEKGYMDWGVCAVSLRSNDIQKLEAQDYLYSVVEQSRNGARAPRIIGSMRETLWANNGPRAIIDRMMDPNIKLVTMTITQEAYRYRKDTILDFDADDIKGSLENFESPSAMVGFLVAALKERKEAGMSPFSIMSCDNFEDNGKVLRGTTLAYAGRMSTELRDWIAENVSFQGTMVDRIVPKTTDLQKAHFHQRYHVKDICPIFTEDFRQMVVSVKNRTAETPPLDEVGGLLVPDVVPYELMKIRLLNGAHMALGMLGRLNRYTHVDEALKDPDVKKYISDYMEEVQKTLPEVPGVDLDEYRGLLMDRLENPYMKDQLVRLARNGTSKMNSRFVGALNDSYASGEGMESRQHLLLAVSFWIEYLRQAARDSGFDIMDKQARESGLLEIAETITDDPYPIFLNEETDGIWNGLNNNPKFIDEIRKVYARLDRHLHDRISDQLGLDPDDDDKGGSGPKGGPKSGEDGPK